MPSLVPPDPPLNVVLVSPQIPPNTGNVARTCAVTGSRLHLVGPIRFSLDETMDVGEDTGTPVIEDYVDKMPFHFTGDLKKVVIELGKSGLTASDEKAVEEGKEKAAAAAE